VLKKTRTEKNVVMNIVDANGKRAHRQNEVVAAKLDARRFGDG
jgi:hypothetical protein